LTAEAFVVRQGWMFTDRSAAIRGAVMFPLKKQSIPHPLWNWETGVRMMNRARNDQWFE
jgi:hypothetical protein